MVGGESLVGIGRDAAMSAGSSTGGSGGILYLASGSSIGGSESLVGGRGGLDRIGGHSSTYSGSVEMSRTDTVGICLYALRHNDSPTQTTR